MASTVHDKHYLTWNLFKKVLVVTASLIISGCAINGFDNGGVLQRSTFDFIIAVPPECAAGKVVSWQCWFDKNPARRCIVLDEDTNKYKYPNATCMAQTYPQCFDQSTKKISQACIGKLADARVAEQQELERKKQQDEEIKKVQAQQAAAEKEKARAEYEKSPQGVSEQKSEAASNKKLASACNHFITDLGRIEAFKEPKLIHAVNAMPNVVMCTYSVTEKGVYADIPKVITITGNTQNGVYNY